MFQNKPVQEYKALSNKLSFLFINPKFTLNIDRLSIDLVTIDESRNLKLLIEQRDFLEDNKIIYREGTLIFKLDDDYRNRYKPKKNGYRYVLDIYSNNEIIGHLYLEDKRNNLKGVIQLEFLNYVFYKEDWYAHYLNILKCLNLKFYKIAYVEIAFDSYGKYEMFKELYFNSISCGKERFKHAGKSKIGTFNNNAMFQIGALKATGKSIVIYNKSEEIIKSNKVYIRQYHKINGLDVSKIIDRVELRMNNNYLCKYDINIEKLSSQCGLEEIYKSFTRGCLSFYDHYSEIPVALGGKQWSLIDYSSFRGNSLNKLKKTDAILTLRKYEIKRNFKGLLYIYISSGSHHALELIKSYISDEKHRLLSNISNRDSLIDGNKISKQEYLKLTQGYIKSFKFNSSSEEIKKRKSKVIYDVFFN
ncbi:hypothetical protein DP923_03140 [Pontibacter arcticus]|uniref:Uncharacterized protein n=1 Tax=Pontibacter arcticus TaxID=2080288 RepID=A0A364RIF2_9BACT|nr:hypothetical protein DP923_03140 [Pontibacter arcticus]